MWPISSAGHRRFIAQFLAIVCLLLPNVVLAQSPLRGHGGPVRTLLLRPDSRELISGSFDNSIIVWDLAQNHSRQVLRFHDGAINAIAQLADDCFASGAEDRRIAVWCGKADVPTSVFTAHDSPVKALTSVLNGRAIVSAGLDGAVKLWENGIPRLLHAFPAAATALATSGDGRGVFAGSADGSLRYIVVSGAGETKQVVVSSSVTALSVAGNLVVAASSDGHIRFMSPLLEQLSVLELDNQPVSALSISPNGRLIAAAGLRGGLMIVDRASLTVLARLTGQGVPVWSLVFDQDNRTLLTGDGDRMIRRWDAVAGIPLSSTVPEGEVVVRPNDRGAEVFRACQACHTVNATEGPRAGPTLAGVLARRIGTAPGYVYSDALRSMQIIWTAETIGRLFEVGPSVFTPGTKMPEQTIANPADRQALVDWLARVTPQ